MKDIEALAKELDVHFEDWGHDQPAEIIFYGGLPQLEAFAKALQGDNEPQFYALVDAEANRILETFDTEDGALKAKGIMDKMSQRDCLMLVKPLYTSPPNLLQSIMQEYDAMREDGCFEGEDHPIVQMAREIDNLKKLARSQQAKLDKAIEALRRLSSIEAFTYARAIHPRKGC